MLDKLLSQNLKKEFSEQNQSLSMVAREGLRDMNNVVVDVCQY